MIDCFAMVAVEVVAVQCADTVFPSIESLSFD